jgi:glycosyltransferase involved in cell wall biosynthesis
MKILLIAALFPPYHRGGAEVVAATCARELAKDNEVTVLSIRPWSGLSSLSLALDKDSVISGVRVLRFFPLNIFSFININRHNAISRLVWHALDMFNLHTWWTVRQVLRTLKPDLVLTHNLKGIGYTMPWAIRSFLKTAAGNTVRWVHTIHDLGPLFPRGLLMWGKEKSFDTASWSVQLYGFINRALFGSPEIVISRSQFFLDYFQSCGWFPKSRLVRFTHDVARRTTALAQAPVVTFKFLFVGQLEEYKGIAVLLRAWQQARAKGLMAAELHVVGQGSMIEIVTQEAAKDASVIYHGESLTNSAVLSDLIPHMHAALVPTLVYENTPLVLIEAFAAGLPVAASAIGGVPEAFVHGEAGYLVEPGNVHALAEAIIRITEAPWVTMHEHALRAAEQYTAAQLSLALEQLLLGSQKG